MSNMLFLVSGLRSRSGTCPRQSVGVRGRSRLRTTLGGFGLPECEDPGVVTQGPGLEAMDDVSG